MYDDEANYDRDWDRGREDAHQHHDNTGQVPETYNEAEALADDDKPRSQGWIDGWNHAIAHDFD